MNLNNFEMIQFGVPQIISVPQTSQTMQSLTLSLGLDYWIRLGVGYNFK